MIYKSPEFNGRNRHSRLGLSVTVGALALATLIGPKMPADALNNTSTCYTGSAEINEPGFYKYLQSAYRQQRHKTLLAQKVGAIQKAEQSGVITLDESAPLPDGRTSASYTGLNGVEITLTGNKGPKDTWRILDGLKAERIQPANSPALNGLIKATILRDQANIFVGSYTNVVNNNSYTQEAATVMLAQTAGDYSIDKVCQVVITGEAGAASHFTKGQMALTKKSAQENDGELWGSTNALLVFGGIALPQ